MKKIFSASTAIIGLTVGLLGLSACDGTKTPPTLNTPVLEVDKIEENLVATWSYDEHAEHYELFVHLVGGEESETLELDETDLTIDASEASYAVPLVEIAAGEYEFKVRAIGDGTNYLNSAWSAVVTYEVVSTTNNFNLEDGYYLCDSYVLTVDGVEVSDEDTPYHNFVFEMMVVTLQEGKITAELQIAGWKVYDKAPYTIDPLDGALDIDQSPTLDPNGPVPTIACTSLDGDLIVQLTFSVNEEEIISAHTMVADPTYNPYTLSDGEYTYDGHVLMIDGIEESDPNNAFIFENMVITLAESKLTAELERGGDMVYNDAIYTIDRYTGVLMVAQAPQLDPQGLVPESITLTSDYGDDLIIELVFDTGDHEVVLTQTMSRFPTYNPFALPDGIYNSQSTTVVINDTPTDNPSTSPITATLSLGLLTIEAVETGKKLYDQAPYTIDRETGLFNIQQEIMLDPSDQVYLESVNCYSVNGEFVLEQTYNSGDSITVVTITFVLQAA